MKAGLKNWKREKGRILFYATVAFFPLLQFFIFYVCVNINSILMAFQNDAGDFIWLQNFEEAFNLLFLDAVMGEMWGNTAILLFILSRFHNRILIPDTIVPYCSEEMNSFIALLY